MQVGVIFKSIVISEDLEACARAMRKMAEMEPRFSLANIKIVFADQGVTAYLLCKLGIHDCHKKAPLYPSGTGSG